MSHSVLYALNEEVEFPKPNPVFRVSYFDSLPITAKDIVHETEREKYVLSGWSKSYSNM